MAPATSFKMFSWKRKPGTREAALAVNAVPQVVVSPATDVDPRMALPDGIPPPLRTRTSSRPTSPSSASFGTSGPHWARRGSAESYSSPEHLDPKTPPSYSSATTSQAPLPSTPYRTTVTRARSTSDETVPATARQIGYAQRSPERRVTTRFVTQQPQDCRVSSLYASSAGSTSSLSTVMDSGRTPLGSTRRQSLLWRGDASQSMEPPAPALPMFNIIPATPKVDDLDGNEDIWQEKRDPSTTPGNAPGLDEAIEITSPSLNDRSSSEAVYEWAAECGAHDVITPHWSPAASVSSGDYFDPLPMIDIDLDFSPFSPVVDLPEVQIAQTTPTVSDAVLVSQPSSAPPSAPLPPSPPFLSYPSLPSLSSASSSLSTSSSLCSFPDVDEALGSMLASLSEPNLSGASPDGEPKRLAAAGEVWAEPSQFGTGLGLGLGLGLEDVPPLANETPRAPSVTQPLVPRPQRRPPPPPLILADRALIAGPSVLGSPLRSPSTAPLIKNHRLAFYNRVQAHPASPTAGVFINLDGVSPASSSGQTPLPGQQLTHSGSGYFPVFQPSGASVSSTPPASARSSTSSRSSESRIASSDSSVGEDCVDEEDELAIQTASILSLVPSPAEGRSKAGLVASPAARSEEWVAKTRSAEIVGWAM